MPLRRAISTAKVDGTEGVATYAISAKMSGSDLASKLSEGPFEKMIEVQDLKLNRIQAKAKGG